MTDREPLLARVGGRIADLTEKYFPDAFVFALAIVAIVFIAGMAVGESPIQLATEFGQGFWVLIPFTMQMVLIIVGGFVVASSRPCSRLIAALADIPASPRSAVAFVAFFAMASSLFSWGFSLIFTGLLVREIVRRIDGVDYRAIGAAAYLGLGSVWALGLSSSSALMQATPSSIPSALLPITGVIPLTQTIFLWQNIVLALVLIGASVAIAYYSCPDPSRAKTAESMGIRFEPMVIEDEPPTTPAEKLERSPVLTLFAALLLIVYLGHELGTRGVGAALDLNTFNLIFITLGLLLHWRPRSFLKAVSKSVPATAGVIIQFPF
jgi:short-chain fatty acids transporter